MDFALSFCLQGILENIAMFCRVKFGLIHGGTWSFQIQLKNEYFPYWTSTLLQSNDWEPGQIRPSRTHFSFIIRTPDGSLRLSIWWLQEQVYKYEVDDIKSHRDRNSTLYYRDGYYQPVVRLQSKAFLWCSLRNGRERGKQRGEKEEKKEERHTCMWLHICYWAFNEKQDYLWLLSDTTQEIYS